MFSIEIEEDIDDQTQALCSVLDQTFEHFFGTSNVRNVINFAISAHIDFKSKTDTW